MCKKKSGQLERISEEKLELVRARIKEESINVNDVVMERLLGQLQNTRVKPARIAYSLGIDSKIIHDLRRIVQSN